MQALLLPDLQFQVTGFIHVSKAWLAEINPDVEDMLLLQASLFNLMFYLCSILYSFRQDYLGIMSKTFNRCASLGTFFTFYFFDRFGLAFGFCMVYILARVCIVLSNFVSSTSASFYYIRLSIKGQIHAIFLVYTQLIAAVL